MTTALFWWGFVAGGAFVVAVIAIAAVLLPVRYPDGDGPES